MHEPSIHPSVHLGPGSNIAADATVGPDCVLGGDVAIGARAKLEAGVQVGAGSVLMRGVEIGTGARIEAGSVVTRPVPAHAIVAGNPAVVVGFVTTEPPPAFSESSNANVIQSRAVAGVSFHRFPVVREPRGSLIFSEFGAEVPFVPKRYFMVHDVPAHHLRGTHARETCGELLVCVAGSINAVVDDGFGREEYVLDRPHLGLYIPPLVWATQYKHTPDAILMVFATHHYDAGDYIVDYQGFVAERQAARASKR